MFAGLKRRRDEARDEARVDEVAEELADLLQQYGRLVPADRREVLTAFEKTLSDFEQELGV